MFVWFFLAPAARIFYITRHIRHMGAAITYIIYSILVDSCLQQQTGLPVKAMLSYVVESIHILLQAQENTDLILRSFIVSLSEKSTILDVVFIEGNVLHWMNHTIHLSAHWHRSRPPAAVWHTRSDLHQLPGAMLWDRPKSTAGTLVTVWLCSACDLVFCFVYIFILYHHFMFLLHITLFSHM